MWNWGKEEQGKRGKQIGEKEVKRKKGIEEKEKR